MEKVDLNCDMGESTDLHNYDVETDLQMLRWVSSINLACGFHAGDAYTMHQLTEAALESGVAIGAHPSFYDRDHFGRRPIQLSPARIYDQVLYQVGALHAFLHVYGSKIHHLKPHGALYNMAAKNRPIADAICQAAAAFDKDILIYGLSGSELISAAQDAGLKPVSEVFADRTYQQDGSLTPRSDEKAVISERQQMIEQLLDMIGKGTVNTLSGDSIPVTVETVCIHSDTTGALELARFINETLKKEHVIIRQP
jgi:5-oxoprolinase (ATP-hydrolysing) subunit A